MTAPLDKVRADFDRIARLLSTRSEHPDLYDAFLVSQVPRSCSRVLEVGCGTGRLARTLAEGGATVTGIDASPEMIQLARERAGDDPRLRFICDDFLRHAFDANGFDCVISVATLHHLDAAAALARMRDLVRLGGVLVLHDLWSPSSLVDWLCTGWAALTTRDGWTWIGRRRSASRELRDAWRDHGADERYLTNAEVRSLYALHLNGANVYIHSLWRYTAVWTRPGE